MMPVTTTVCFNIFHSKISFDDLQDNGSSDNSTDDVTGNESGNDVKTDKATSTSDDDADPRGYLLLFALARYE